MTKIDTCALPVLETQRLTLRELRLSDTGLVSLYSSDPRVARMTTRIPCPNPPEITRAFIESVLAAENGDFVWAIDATKGYGAEVIGIIALHEGGEVGYWLGPFFWGLGLATEALSAVLAFAEARGDRRFHANVFQENPASRRVLEKQGFRLTGTGESHSLSRDAVVATWQFVREVDDG